MSVNPALLEKIKTSVDIVELIKEYIPLKQAGRNFKAICPFHREKTPSFMVSPEKQIFHCFGCGAGGDSVTFLMKHEKLNFGEAVRMLASRAGIKIPQASAKDSAYISRLYEIMEVSAGFYERYLFTKDGRASWAYLIKRGLTINEIKKFRIGLSPSSWDLLYKVLSSKGFTPREMETAGLVLKKGNGYCDRFRERIMFPIMNEWGKVVAFGGRTIKDVQPKYINSPETPIYRKGMVLYGLNFAKRKILKEKKVMVVEGYMDLISLFQSGFDFSVSSLGTALTPMQLRLLKRFSQHIILAYDADKGGEEATFRGIEEALRLGFSINVLEFPEGNDPEEYLHNYGAEDMARLIKNSPDFFNFRIKSLEKIYADKIKIVRSILSMIRHIPGALEKNFYIRHLSERYSIPEETLRIEIKNLKRDYRDGEDYLSKNTAGFSQEREVMKIVLRGGELSAKARKYLEPQDFEDRDLREIAHLVFKSGYEALDLNRIAQERLRSTITRLLVEDLERFSPDELLDEFILRAIKKRKMKKANSLLEEIKIEERKGNLVGVRKKQREYEELIRSRNGR